MCNLPDVKFENFVAARSCLQTTLAPSGAVVGRISIQQDQNGKAKWRVNLSASGNFPIPNETNFVRVRAVLNQHVPHRGVLSTINLESDYSTTEGWNWEVTYSIKKVTKLRRAINTLSAVIKTATPCLKIQPTIRTAIVKKENLEKLETTKNRKRFFFNLRQARKSKEPKDTNVSSKTDASKKQFVKGETLLPTQTVRKSTNVHNIAPDYESWDVKGIIFSMKQFTVQDVKCLAIVNSCTGVNSGTDPVVYAAAVMHLKDRCAKISRQHIPKLLKEGLEQLNVSEAFLNSFKLKGDRFERLSVRDHHFYRGNDSHILCNH